MSDPKSSSEPKPPSIFNQSWNVAWRKAAVSLPRLVPDIALRFTSPDGPHPVITKLPSRGKHKIPVYIFIPPSIAVTSAEAERQSTQTISCPVLLDFHGGGFVQGSCLEQAPFCSKLCRELNCIAISVDYRLGPYAQFPAALEDGEDVLNAILHPSKPGYNELRRSINESIPKPKQANPNPNTTTTVSLDITRLAFSGFSSGGNIAFNLALSLPQSQPYLPTAWPSPLPQTHTTPVALLLFFPSLDTRLLPHERPLPTGHPPPTGFLASLRLEAELMPTYLPRTLTSHPRASPCLVSLHDPSSSPPSETGSLHPTSHILLVSPTLDAITTQNAVWAERVTTENPDLKLEVVDVPDMFHGWTQFPDGWLDVPAKERKREVFERAVAFTRECWG